ncbi:zinc finger protein 585B-like isoform X2 [Pseudophryne corroboree]|uniref:zinc finger protein 585B-like isoform X2 n=1 Tax=Pseudophryne corroboree TaxID=495146 RepID=UPI003081624B
MEDRTVGTELVKIEASDMMPDQPRVDLQLQGQLKCEPPLDADGVVLRESMDCLVDYNLGTQLTVEQEIQIGDAAPPCLSYDMSFLPKKTPKPRQRKLSGERNFTCGQCSKSFLRSTDLAKHEKAHADERTYVCNICGKNFRRHTSLLIHARIHTGERPYQCTQCGKSFIQRQHLTTHQRTHTGEKPFQCIECGKGFRWRSELLKHQKNHTEKSIGFDDLASSFSKEEWMELEEWQKELYRNVMKETSETLISLGEGLVEKAIIEKTPDDLDPAASLAVECANSLPLCAEGAVACSNALSAGEGPLGQTADVAEGKAAAFTDGVDKMRMKFLDRPNANNADRAHACAECGKVFYNKRTLKAHLRAHLGERSYICNVCGKCFRRHTSLLIHERIHTGERPYHCTQCGKSFVQRQHLNTHQKTHTGEKPFQCQECRKGFRWRSELVKHQKVHEDEVADTSIKEERGDSDSCEQDVGGTNAGDRPKSLPAKHRSAGKRRPRNPKADKAHACAECGKIFYNKRTLKAHLRAHLGERSYICNVCGKCFRRHTALLIHERIHTGERPYKCLQCGKSFIQQQHLTTHKRIHTGEKPFPCQVCGNSYRWRSELAKHQKVHEKESSANSLEDGQKETTGRKRRYKREGQGPLGALERGKALGKRARMLLRQRAQKGDRALSCQECGKNFLNKRTLRSHQRVHTDERSYICNVCGKSFRRHTSLLIHERIHTGERPYQCAQCGKSFIQRQHLTTHLKTHTGEKPFQCSQCGKGYRWRSELVKHQKVHEEEETLLSSMDASCKTEKETFLEDDWKAINGGQTQQSTCREPGGDGTATSKDRGARSGRPAQERLFPCTQCEKSFLRSSDLVRHQRSHLGERPYVCNQCGKCFRRNTSLLIHERIHTGERPYQCAQCGKSFVQRQHLTTHLKTHTGEKPFPCTLCGKSYRWRSELVKHQRVHSGEASVSFDDVAVCFSDEWKDLEDWQKELYRNMMKESADSLISLGEVWINKNGKEMPPERNPDDLELSCDSKEHIPLGADLGSEVNKFGVPQELRDFSSHSLQSDEPHTSADALRGFRQSLQFLDQRRVPREKLFPCSECEKRFSRNSDLLKHQRSHQAGEKPNLCNECGKIFRRRTALLIHKRIHTGERPYKCKQCGKCFVQRQHLTTHVKTHTGERPYPCNQCGKSYRWRSELNKHQKVHANVLGPPIDYIQG